MNPSKDETVSLAAAIELVRQELETVRDRSQAARIRFVPGPVELEFQVAVTHTTDTEGGIRLGVVAVGGKGSAAHQQTHRLKVILTPTDARGGALDISDVSDR